jgi:N6-L-threonylcarbamoyladenine synthase
MIVLGIETSCDETAVAAVKDGKEILSNVVSSSLKFHRRYGGVVPEIASRKQLESIALVADTAIREAKIKLRDIDLISVSAQPGLAGSLLVGVAFARSLALSLRVRLIETNHLHSHIYANFLNGNAIKAPFVALVVSGGHTSLFYVQGFSRIETLGQTQDDACGEAFDKVAKILGLGYPGGPLIEKLARKGNPGKIRFSCSGTKGPWDFSFSGIKTAVLYYFQKHSPPSVKRTALKNDIAASFQEAVINALVSKSFLACKRKKSNRLLLGGGVVANSRLREEFSAAAKSSGCACFFPPRQLCLDNAAMVAGLGWRLFKEKGGGYAYG